MVLLIRSLVGCEVHREVVPSRDLVRRVGPWAVHREGNPHVDQVVVVVAYHHPRGSHGVAQEVEEAYHHAQVGLGLVEEEVVSFLVVEVGDEEVCEVGHPCVEVVDIGRLEEACGEVSSSGVEQCGCHVLEVHRCDFPSCHALAIQAGVSEDDHEAS